MLALSFLLLATTSASHADLQPPVQLEECTFPSLERTARCGALTVLENRLNPEGRHIDLRLVVLPATSGQPAPDALAYLVGGPGNAATKSVRFLSDSLQKLQQHRDIILVDQRGTGDSNRLDCRLSPEEQLRAAFELRVAPERLQACRQNLDADPAFYTTSHAVDDLEAVRAALGYEQLSLIGMSYGTRVALAYLRQFPGRVRTVTLRAAASPATNVLLGVLRASNAVMDDLIGSCAADPACSDSFPDFPRQLRQVLARLEKEPVPIALGSSSGGAEILLTHQIFSGALQYALYSDRGARALPALVDRAAQGNFKVFAKSIATARLQGDSAAALGMYLSVICAEDAPFLEPDSLRDELAASFIDLAVLAQFRETCSSWPVPPVAPSWKDPVASDVPVLFLSGGKDPAVSAAAAAEVARHLPNSLHVISPELGHHPTWTNCFASTAAAFVDRGSVVGLEVTCEGDFQAAAFHTSGSWPWAIAGLVVLVALVVILARRRRRQAEPDRELGAVSDLGGEGPSLL